MNGSNRKQNVSINGYDWYLADEKFVVLQGSALSPLLFLIYINDLNQAFKVCHFSDETNVLRFSKSVYRITNMLTLT